MSLLSVRLTYLDTSAVMKLVVEESETGPLIDELEADEERRFVSSWLLHTELHCAAGRHPSEIGLEAVDAVLDTVDLIDLTRGDLLAAGTHAPLRANNAIHLAVALRVGVDDLIGYDAELVGAASAAGLRVICPGTRSH